MDFKEGSMRFETSTAVKMSMVIFWVTPPTLTDVSEELTTTIIGANV
jgi:hypothetical protein